MPGSSNSVIRRCINHMANRIGLVPASNLYIDIPEANKVYTSPDTWFFAPRPDVGCVEMFAGQKD